MGFGDFYSRAGQALAVITLGQRPPMAGPSSPASARRHFANAADPPTRRFFARVSALVRRVARVAPPIIRRRVSGRLVPRRFAPK